MRNFILVSFLITGLFIQSSLSQTGWNIIPSPSTENLFEISYQSFTASDWVMGANGILFKTPDHGETWQFLNSGTSFDLRGHYSPASFQDWLAGAAGTVLVSTDLGVSWIPRAPNTTVNFNAIFSRGSGTAYVAGEAGSVFYSDDFGVNWASRPVPSTATLNCGIGPTSGTTLHALVGGDNGVIYKTTDAGINWTETNSGISNSINDFGFGPGGMIYAVGDSGIIFKSDNAGDTWTMLNSPTTENLYAINTSGQNASWTIACGANGTIVKSTDAGDSWVLQSTPTTEPLYGALAVTNNIHLVVGANGTILKTIDGGGDPVGLPENNLEDKEFMLLRNYPNPFGSLTNIEFTLFETTEVSLKVYDILGSEVASLVSKKLEVGKHIYVWDATSVEAGIYYYRIEKNGISRTRKCMVVK